MHRKNALDRERGFIALYALMSLAFLVTMAVLVMAHWDGMIQQMRWEGGGAQAERVAHGFLQERLAEEWTTTPRPWIPALRGEEMFEGISLEWERQPLDGRWHASGRSWTPEWIDAWNRLGARADRLSYWQEWIEQRRLAALQVGSGGGDLIQDRDFMRRIFEDLGLGERWSTPNRMWTMDEGGASNRLNLVGADPEVISILSGVPRERIAGFLARATIGFPDAASASEYWRFDEQQALSQWASTHPFSASVWIIDVRVPSLHEPVRTRWRVDQAEGTPGSPWFRVQPWSGENW